MQLNCEWVFHHQSKNLKAPDPPEGIFSSSTWWKCPKTKPNLAFQVRIVDRYAHHQGKGEVALVRSAQTADARHGWLI